MKKQRNTQTECLVCGQTEVYKVYQSGMWLLGGS